MENLLFWVIGAIVVVALIYKFYPKGRAAIDRKWNKIDEKDDGRGLR